MWHNSFSVSTTPVVFKINLISMKKILVLLAMIGFGAATLCSCGSKSVKGADGTEYSSYQEACRHQDFVAAYDWIEKNDGSDDDKDYVFNAEMLYLTSLGTEEASNRIVFLLAEYQIPGEVVNDASPEYFAGEQYHNAKIYINGVKRFNKRCDNVIDLAITQGNKELALRIVDLYKEDVMVDGDYVDTKYIYFKNPRTSFLSKEYALDKINNAFGTDKE